MKPGPIGGIAVTIGGIRSPHRGPLRHRERAHAVDRGGRIANRSAAGVPLVFKASFDKANRTSLGSFRGPGLDAGLRASPREGREPGCRS